MAPFNVNGIAQQGDGIVAGIVEPLRTAVVQVPFL